MATKHGKRYRAIAAVVDPAKEYSLHEAVELVKKTATAKFDESFDVAIRLGVDPRKADQLVRGTVSLPHGTGKTVRVLVLAKPQKIKKRSMLALTTRGWRSTSKKFKADGPMWTLSLPRPMSWARSANSGESSVRAD